MLRIQLLADPGVFDFIESVIKQIPQKHQKLIRYYGLLSRRLRKWAEKVIDVWRRHEERLLGRQLELFQHLLESKKEADENRNRMRLGRFFASLRMTNK